MNNSGLPKGTYEGQISRWGKINEDFRNGFLAQPLVVDRDLEGVTIRPIFERPKRTKK